MSSVCCLISLLFQIRIKICIFRTGNFFFILALKSSISSFYYIRIFGYLSHCHNIDIRSLRFPFWNLLIQQTDIIGNIVYIINTKPDKNIFISFHLLLQGLQAVSLSHLYPIPTSHIHVMLSFSTTSFIISVLESPIIIVFRITASAGSLSSEYTTFP